MKRQIGVEAQSGLAHQVAYCHDNRKLLVYEGTRYFVTNVELKGDGRAARLIVTLETP